MEPKHSGGKSCPHMSVGNQHAEFDPSLFVFFHGSCIMLSWPCISNSCKKIWKCGFFCTEFFKKGNIVLDLKEDFCSQKEEQVSSIPSPQQTSDSPFILFLGCPIAQEHHGGIWGYRRTVAVNKDFFSKYFCQDSQICRKLAQKNSTFWLQPHLLLTQPHYTVKEFREKVDEAI